jgi:hypothetical protein
MRIATRRVATFVSFISALSLLPFVSRAGWDAGGTGISTAALNQNSSRIISDGSGGAIMVWSDGRSITPAIYAQRVDGYGVAQWAAGGVPVTPLSNDGSPQLMSDGEGGAIIIWQRNNTDIYAQRISGLGIPQWTAGGVAICTAANTQAFATLTTDGSGGAIIAWQDLRNGVDSDIYAQRINSAGTTQWTANGVAVATAAQTQQQPQITTDLAGGVIIAWSDFRSGTSTDVYAQRLNGSGAAQWTANGVALCTATGNQDDVAIASDGANGAYVAWEDFRGATWDIYMQRVSGSGSAQWTANGFALCVAAGVQSEPALLPDPLGAVLAVWFDPRSGTSTDLYVQKMNSAGTAQWTANGVSLGGTASTIQDIPLVTDGQGGAIVVWEDVRNSTSDVYARRINASGVPQWSAGGAVVSTAIGQQHPTGIASDALGGAFVVWDDTRSGLSDVYAQRIERNGYWGYPAPNIARVRDVPGDQGGQVNVSWDASRLDMFPDELIDTYTVWRSLSPSAAASTLAAGAETWSSTSRVPAANARDVIRIERAAATTYYWQLIHTVTAFGIPGYSDIVPTPFDSTQASNQAIAFQVIAHAATGQWVSSPATGRSIDNIAPAPPVLLSAQRLGADVHLAWKKNHEPDLDGYRVYRKTSSGVTPIPSDFLSDSEDTVLVDASAPFSSLYYIVTAVDAHDNQSAKSNEASVSPVTGVNDTPRSYTLSVSVYPNPFNPRTTVRYTLPSRGRVSVRVYDATGAFVATLYDGERNAGAYSADWDGRAATGAFASSGVYFARVDHNGSSRTKKMVLLK